MIRSSVATSRVGPIISLLLEQRWPECERRPDEQSGLEILAENVGCDESAIRRIIDQRYKAVDFDTADRLLCALGRPDMWRGELSDVFDACDLRTEQEAKKPPVRIPRKCGWCKEKFVATRKDQRYCSVLHRKRAGYSRSDERRRVVRAA